MIFLDSAWMVLLELAPWLLLGALVAGLLHGLLPDGFVRRHLHGRWGVLKAVGLGVPLPLCSCGVIPAGLGLKKDGASDGASVGFLISTPQTGVDSMLVSAAFFGWPFALVKVVGAAATGIVGGLWTDRGIQPTPDEPETPPPPTGHRSATQMVAHSAEVLRSIWRWLAFGVLVSAAISTFVPDAWLSGLGAWGVLGGALAALMVSLPLYVCATASVPIAAALVAGGMPTGAALVFLMAGPATNVATVGAVHRAFGGRVLAIYLSTIIVGSMGLALSFDFVLAGTAEVSTHMHHGSWWEVSAAVLLLAMMAWFAVEELRALVLNASIARSRTSQPSAKLEVDSCCASGQHDPAATTGASPS